MLKRISWVRGGWISPDHKCCSIYSNVNNYFNFYPCLTSSNSCGRITKCLIKVSTKKLVNYPYISFKWSSPDFFVNNKTTLNGLPLDRAPIKLEMKQENKFRYNRQIGQIWKTLQSKVPHCSWIKFTARQEVWKSLVWDSRSSALHSGFINGKSCLNICWDHSNITLSRRWVCGRDRSNDYVTA